MEKNSIKPMSWYLVDYSNVAKIVYLDIPFRTLEGAKKAAILCQGTYEPKQGLWISLQKIPRASSYPRVLRSIKGKREGISGIFAQSMALRRKPLGKKGEKRKQNRLRAYVRSLLKRS